MYFGGRLFRPVTTSASSQTSADTIFKYEQSGTRITATYSGGDIRFGQILGRVRDDGCLDLRYHHIDRSGRLMTGICVSTPEERPNGKLRLKERWRWTCGDKSGGESVLEEI